LKGGNLRGILCMLTAVAVLAVMDAVMKALGTRYPPFEIACLRGLMSIPFVLAWVYTRHRGFSTLIRVRWGLQLGRGLLAVVMLGAFIYGLTALPISEAYALFFVAPLLIAALSAPLLGEEVDGRRWSAILAGFLGVLIVLRPGLSKVGAGSLAILAAACCYSLNAIAVRVLGRTDSTAAMTFWFVTLLGLGAGMLALPAWRPVETEDIVWLLVLGATGSAGQFLLTEAFRRTPASVVAPFDYTALLWAVLLDRLVFGVLPDWVVFAGAGVIVLSGLYLVNRERFPLPVTFSQPR
jgi:drug/metabolite transporter (DMT)-like permease